MTVETWLEVAKVLGLPACLCMFFIWQNKLNNERSNQQCLEREERLETRMTAQEEFTRTTLVNLAMDSSAIAKESRAVIQQCNDSINQAVEKIGTFCPNCNSSIS